MGEPVASSVACLLRRRASLVGLIGDELPSDLVDEPFQAPSDLSGEVSVELRSGSEPTGLSTYFGMLLRALVLRRILVEVSLALLDPEAGLSIFFVGVGLGLGGLLSVGELASCSSLGAN